VEGDEDLETILPTAIYHSFMSPTIYSEPGTTSEIITSSSSSSGGGGSGGGGSGGGEEEDWGGAYVGLDGELHHSYDDAAAFGGFCPSSAFSSSSAFATKTTASTKTKVEDRRRSLSSSSNGEGGNNDEDFSSQWAASSQQLSAAHFSDLSLWDTFRTMNPWLLLTQKPVAMGLLRSLGAMTKQQDAFPHW
jgi:hypothetical protein